MGVLEPILVEAIKNQNVFKNLNKIDIHKIPRIYTHQIDPKSVWHQADIVFLFDVVGSILIYIKFIIFKPIKSKFIFYKNLDNQFAIGNKGTLYINIPI